MVDVRRTLCTQGWGYVYIVQPVQGPVQPEAEAGTKPTLVVTDLHRGSDCGPIVIDRPRACTKFNCDREYTFGDGSSQFLSSLRHGWLIQDVHDPNDVTWGHNEFAQVQLHGPATIYCLLPTLGAAGGVSEATCQNAYCEGHSHTLQEVQQALPMWAAQNWQPTGQTITESNGVVCEIYKIQASQPTTLYHTTHLGWSLVYIVDYEPPAGQYTQATGSMTGASIFGQQSRPVSGQPKVQELHGDGFESCGKPVLRLHRAAARSIELGCDAATSAEPLCH